MTTTANIIVQLVHIEGPLKGEIQELFDDEIVIGRHPDCQVHFPKDVVTISRRHARIVRDGNRFKIIDQSTNGTFVNGKAISEIYLKDGDVVAFSEGGPKLSFLTQVSDTPRPASPQAIQTQEPEPPHSYAPATPPPRPPARPAPPPRPTPTAQTIKPLAPAVPKVKVPFAIQYGPALKSFQMLPITLGSGARCDFVINHAAVNEQQAQIFFDQDQYWVKDLTGMNAVCINGIPVSDSAPLQPDCNLALSAQGPTFRFLSGGRLAEVEDPQHARPVQPPKTAEPETGSGPEDGQKGKITGKLFKKFFS